MRGAGITVSLFVFASLVAATNTVETVNAQSNPVATLKVDITGNAFSPPDIIVLKGSKVTWTNKDSTLHTVTNDAGSPESIDDPYAPAAASPAATGDHTFTALGVTKYTCRIHPGMHGSVTVVERFDPVQVPVVEVSADDTNQFLPRLVALNASQGIVWSNAGESLHDVTFEDASIGSLGDLRPGGSLQLNFTKEGTYVYRCKYHAADFKSGMIGHIGVGANTTLPVLVTVTSPAPGSNVSGHVEIKGTTESGPGRPDIDRVEVGFDGAENWTAAQGIGSWTFAWHTMDASDGPHTILVRALAQGEELARTELTLVVANQGMGANGTHDAHGMRDPGSEGSTPGPTFAIVVLAVALGLVRRRR